MAVRQPPSRSPPGSASGSLRPFLPGLPPSPRGQAQTAERLRSRARREQAFSVGVVTSRSWRYARMVARSRRTRDGLALQRHGGMSCRQEAGLVAQKKTLRADEQDRPDVARRRKNFAIARRFADLDQFVFLDESCAKTNMTRLYGRAPVGQRCYFSTPYGHWSTTTLLSAIRCTGVIENASIVFDGPTDAIVFRGYVERCLAPSLRAGDIVVMDKLTSPKVTGVREAIESVDASVWYLPPYSPDLNPIEKMWSKIKTWLRRVAARTVEGLIDAIGQAFRAVHADECRAYFRSCGYGTLDC